MTSLLWMVKPTFDSTCMFQTQFISPDGFGEQSVGDYGGEMTSQSRLVSAGACVIDEKKREGTPSRPCRSHDKGSHNSVA
jgi:hypothetical protein